MNRKEHLMVIAMEESAEVAQRISKALRFGLGEVEPGETADNQQRILDEWTDLVAVMAMAGFSANVDRWSAECKMRKIERYLLHSRECGTLTEDEPPSPLPRGEGEG